VLFEDGEDVLQEVELLVAGRRPEIVAVDDQRFALLVAGVVDDSDAAFLAEGRVGEHHLVLAVLAGQGIPATDDWQVGGRFSTDAVEEQIHRAEARHAIDQFDAQERAAFQPPLLLAIQRVMFREIVVRGK